jgi:deoxyribonuclease II
MFLISTRKIVILIISKIKMIFYLILFVLIILPTKHEATLNNLSCKNENGESVDWFYLYKLPKLTNKIKDFKELNSGTSYVYMTEMEQKWKLSEFSINDTKSLPGMTLNVLYKNLSLSYLNDLRIGYILYNDQADKVTLINGHTKGVLLFDSISAVWIVHSIPHYPPKLEPRGYYINASQLVYGQSMLCLTVKFDTLEDIGQQLLYNYPQIYDYYIPDSFKATNMILDNILSVLKGKHVEQAPWYHLTVLETFKNNHRFLSFAKFTNFEDDLYTVLVAEQLKSNLATETWNNGPGTLPSNCSLKYSVFNIQEVSFNFLNVSFSVHNDHSKWAVTLPSSLANIAIACVGDINRQVEQYKRAGGTLCLLDNVNIWQEYYGLVNNFDVCKIKV